MNCLLTIIISQINQHHQIRGTKNLKRGKERLLILIFFIQADIGPKSEISSQGLSSLQMGHDLLLFWFLLDRLLLLWLTCFCGLWCSHLSFFAFKGVGSFLPLSHSLLLLRCSDWGFNFAGLWWSHCGTLGFTSKECSGSSRKSYVAALLSLHFANIPHVQMFYKF